jgi:hypothetical protein
MTIAKRRRPRNYRRPWDPLFLDLNGGKRVDLRKDARAAGRENLPVAGATQPTELETTIATEFEGQNVELAETARAELQRLSATLADTETQLLSERNLTDTVINAAADVDREMGTATALVSLWSDREQRLRDLRIFARGHGLVRDARYPASRWLQMGVLALLILLESCANAAYFAEASDFGLFGGFFRAGTISLLNIIGGFFVGRLVMPWLAYRHPRARIVAAIGLILAVAAALVFNVALAAYRDQLANASVGGTTLVELLRDPFHLSFMSIALFGTGLLAWFLALWKGYVSDDGYPFYGSLDRRYREADRAFAAARDALVGRVIARVRRVPSDCQDGLARGTAVLGRLDVIVREARYVWEAYETDRQDRCARCTVHLRVWRDENQLIRTDPSPAYFSEFPAFPTLVPERLVRDLEDRARLARASHQRLEIYAHGILVENEGRLTAALERVQRHIHDLMSRAGRDGPSGPTVSSPQSGRSAR